MVPIVSLLRVLVLVLQALMVVSGGAALAAVDPVAATPAGEPGTAAPGGGPTGGAGTTSPSSAAGDEIGGDPTSTTAGVPMVDAAAQKASPVRFGLGTRLRVTSIPKWLLGLFLDESVPLTSYTAGLEGFLRIRSLDLVLGVAYQPLSPSAGNWLGKGNPPSIDTDYIQFDGLSALSFDLAAIMRTDFNEYVGIHYGGGIGIGTIFGRMLRTSAGSSGCAMSPGNEVVCHPVVNNCLTGPCTEGQLAGTEGGVDSPANPSRFAESRIPSVYPIVNLVTGLDLRLPTIPGFALKLDMGYFFPYFFLGLGAAYQI